MHLRSRYRKLTFWNKTAFWGSLASLLSLPLAVLLTYVSQVPQSHTKQVKPDISLIGREIKMDKSGKEVEELVQSIEQQLLPQGFKVEPRQRIFNEAGEQIAELDLVISGTLGSSSVRWLIECRDRPSEGAAPISWIEQLVGRKERLLFDKVFAVSTTGFSSPARDFAKTKGIILRTVTQFTDIKSDFMIQSLSYYFELIDFAGPMQMQFADPNHKPSVDVNDPMFKRAEDSEFLHLPTFVSRNPEHVYPIDQNAGLVEFKYNDWLDLRVGDDLFRVHLVQIPLRVSKSTQTHQALLATIYAEDGKPIWLEGQYEADTPKGKVKSRVQVFMHQDGTQSVQLLNDELPDGYFPDRLEVYGRN
jgi:Restriction endonuclease